MNRPLIAIFVVCLLSCLPAKMVFAGGDVFTQAEEEMSFQVKQQWADDVYGTLAEYEYFSAPLISGSVGVALGGWRGAFLGFMVGVVDELLAAYSKEWPYYLTKGFLGAGMLDKLDVPYYLNYGAGGLLGVLQAGGHLEQYREFMGEPLRGAIHGHVYSGTQAGVLAGAMVGGVDGLLKNGNFTGAGYLSDGMLALAQSKAIGTALGMLLYLPKIGEGYAALAAKFAQVPLKTEALAGLLTAYYWYQASQKSVVGEESVSAFKIIDDFKATLVDILGEETFKGITQRYELNALGLPLLDSQLSFALSRYCQDFDTQLSHFEHVDFERGKQFFSTIGILAAFLIPYLSEYFVAGLLNDYQSRKLALAAQDRLYGDLVEGEMALKLTKFNDAAALIDKMGADAYTAASIGGTLVRKITDSQVRGVYGLCALGKHHALDFAVFAGLFNDAMMFLGIAINQMENEVQEAMLPLTSKLSSLQKEWHKNPKDVVYGGNQLLLAAKESELREELRALSRKQALLQSGREAFFIGQDIFLNFIIKYGFIGRKMLADGLPDEEKLPFSQYSTVTAAGRGALESYAWYSQNVGNIMQFNQAKANLERLLDYMRQEDELSLGLEYISLKDTTTAIELTDFSVGHEEGTLLDLQNLIIPNGVYVVSGASGSGKTSFLSKIRGIVNNPIWGKGKITYKTMNGAMPSIHQATQVDYLVPYATLSELIVMQSSREKSLDEQQVARIKALLLEIDIDDRGEGGIVAEVEEAKDWGSILSGGQKRKLAILRTIFQEPDIAILDEVFNGLDSGSVKNVQRMLKTYLPHALMLIVDHNYELNNYEQEAGGYFYDGRLHLENKQLHLID